MAGGANAIAPVILSLRGKGVSVRVVCDTQTAKTFRAFNIQADRELGDFSAGTIRQELLGNKANVALTGTQVQEKGRRFTLEQEVWRSGAPSIAVMDGWSNEVVRFSDRNLEAPGYETAEGGMWKHLPTKIVALDEGQKKKMGKLGCPDSGSRIEAFGNPYFEYLRTEYGKLPASTKEDVLSKPVFSGFREGGFTITFFSDDPGYENIGFTEESVAKTFLKAANAFASSGMPVNVIFRPHPDEKRNMNARRAFESAETPFLNKVLHHPASAKGSEPQSDYSIWQLIAASDLIVGTFNNPLFEAMVVDGSKPVIFYQPNIQAQNYPGYEFYQDLAREKAVLITKEDGIYGPLHDAIRLGRQLHREPMDFVDGAIRRVERLLERVSR